MEKIAVAIPLLFLVGMCGICGNGGQEAGFGNPRYQLKNPAELVPCNSAECMYKSLDTCAPSQFDTIINGTHLHAEIRGHSINDECVVYVKVVSVDVSKVPPQYQMLAQGIQGADGICSLTVQDIRDIKNNDIDQNYLLSKCDGPLKDIASALSSS
ncbi:MAG: hypothetical protein N3G76_02295 [Candidatus Micrarchaeota archaeon]|nr:hypothetical protein [Candidatus Micrarchaeota archaeon]